MDNLKTLNTFYFDFRGKSFIGKHLMAEDYELLTAVLIDDQQLFIVKGHQKISCLQCCLSAGFQMAANTKGIIEKLGFTDSMHLFRDEFELTDE